MNHVWELKKDYLKQIVNKYQETKLSQHVLQDYYLRVTWVLNYMV